MIKNIEDTIIITIPYNTPVGHSIGEFPSITSKPITELIIFLEGELGDAKIDINSSLWHFKYNSSNIEGMIEEHEAIIPLSIKLPDDLRVDILDYTLKGKLRDDRGNIELVLSNYPNAKQRLPEKSYGETAAGDLGVECKLRIYDEDNDHDPRETIMIIEQSLETFYKPPILTPEMKEKIDELMEKYPTTNAD